GANGGGTGSLTGFDRQAGDSDGYRFLVLADIKDPVGVVAADGQETGTRPFDIQTLANGQFAAGQDNRLAVEAGGEGDGVAAVGVLDRGPQRASPAVEVVGHGQGAEDGTFLEPFQPRSEPVPLGNQGTGAPGEA